MKKIILHIILLLLAVPALQAQTLEEYLVMAGENNPQLKATYAEYQAALQKVPQAGALPDPEATFSFFLQPMDRYMGREVGSASIMQMFPWFGSLDAAKTEANYMAQMKFTSFIEAKINLYHTVRTTWLSLYQLDEEVKLLERELEILKSLERVALAKYKSGPAVSAPAAPRQSSGAAPTQSTAGSTSQGMAGMGGGSTSGTSTASSGSGSMGGMTGGSMASSGSSMVDVILIRVQVKDMENRLQLLRDSRKPKVAAFNSMLNRDLNLEVQVADTLAPVALPASLSLIQDSIRQNHPMLKMYEWDEKAREAQLRMAKLMGRPMIGVGLEYMVFKPRPDEMSQMAMGGENMVMPMVSISLPIYRKKYKAAQKEAQYAQEAAVQNREATENMLFAELSGLLYDYQRTSSTLQLLEDQIALNEQAIRLLTTNYSVAGAGIEEILRQRQAILTLRQQQLQAITEQHVTVSAINRMMNSDI
ncbi:TolC family protein [Pontibacter chinhatensis]|uniref:Outer membrane efflux protein n=1 Tax=Pontibacter chinhatensis TaxID=1436961 RepID=A0A1I2WYJ7_9BACT|nr:TolC family protein [Pontibacter chinhatensis]SFH05699.1 Outer membrane efflux protein [Pontibacter chinhatensis]